jgi:hypothetical protein
MAPSRFFQLLLTISNFSGARLHIQAHAFLPRQFVTVICTGQIKITYKNA